MRFIDLSRLPVPAEWNAEELRLLDGLANMTRDERSEAFRKKEKYRIWAVWAELLRGLSHGKCWYSELRVTGAKGDVDHYRPKNAVAKEDAPEGHGGYWWQGVVVTNFRYSCQNCNRLAKDDVTGVTYGKGSRFPLRVATARARTRTDSLTAEQPLLIDPTVKADVDLLWFDEDGTVACTDPDRSSVAYKRVEASRVCYHLNEPEILTRRGEVCAAVKRCAETLEELETKLANGDGDARRTLIERKIRLYEMTRDYSEFSAAARATLKAYDYTAAAKEILAS